MWHAIMDYTRLMRVGLALTRHDVLLPDIYRNRLPIMPRILGRTLRILFGGVKGRPGERAARALEKLGPVYIKLGQFIATRPDVFGPQITGDLSRLKDEVPPFDDILAQASLNEAFPGQAAYLFGELGEVKASASIAQVYRIDTDDGPRAVKVLRPNIETKVMNQLTALKRASVNIERIRKDSRRLEPVAFINTLTASMEKELDMRLEAGATDEFAAITRQKNTFLTPAVDWARTSKRILTTEWIEGIPLTQKGALDQPGIDRKALANKVTTGFLNTAIGHGVFHADMHEGNIIITPDGQLGLVDYGIMGRIGQMERRFLAEILYGFIRRDYKRIAEVHFEAGYVPAHHSVGDFAQALRSVGEPIHGKSAEQVSMGNLLMQLFDFTHIFGMHLRAELVLLQKTMVQVEGVARAIDPSHNIWEVAEPVVETWMKKAFGPEGAARLIKQNAQEVTHRLKRLPDMMDKIERVATRLAESPPPEQPTRYPLLPTLMAASALILSLWLVTHELLG